MSLNKLTSSTDYLEKQYLNVGCNDIKCSSLEIGGTPIIPTNIPVTGKYDATIICSIGATDMLNGFVYWEATSNQLKLQFSRLFVLGANTNTISFTMDLPAGYTTAAFISGAGISYATDGTHTLNMTQVAVNGTGTKVVFICSGSNNLSAGNSFFNGSVIVEI
jgi:hypothetical protein